MARDIPSFNAADMSVGSPSRSLSLLAHTVIRIIIDEEERGQQPSMPPVTITLDSPVHGSGV